LLIHRLKPNNHSALQRIFGFAEHLSSMGYRVHILDCALSTPVKYPEKIKSTCHIHSIEDAGEYPRFANCDVDSNYLWHKTKALYNLIAMNLKADMYSGWTKAAVTKAQSLIKTHNITCLISSFAPIAPHLAAMSLKKKNQNLVWIADMRDEYVTSPAFKSLGRKRAFKIEEKICQTADAITTVSKPILDEFAALHPESSVIFEEIRNGYNYNPEPVEKRNDGLFEIAYVGSLYGDLSPKNFFSVLEKLAPHMPEARFHITGQNHQIKIPKKLETTVKKLDPVPYAEAIKIMQRADLLLLILPDNERKGVYSGKIFEYIASGTPILALVPDDDVAAELIAETHTGYIANNEKPHTVEKELLRAYNDWKYGRSLSRDPKNIESCHRKAQVKKLSGLIQTLLGMKN